MSDRSIIFLHIPKTAGTSLQKAIELFYERDEYFCIYDDEERPGMAAFQKLTDAKKRDVKIFMGHFYFGLHENIPQPCTYFTILRNPIDRVISLHGHIKSLPCTSSDQKFKNKWEAARKMSLEEFVASDILPIMHNQQVILLSNLVSKKGEATAESLEKAKSNLKEHFSVIGLTERLDETVILLKRVLGMRMRFIISQNIAKEKRSIRELPEKTINLIKEKNKLDIALYDFVTELFNKQMEKCGRHLDESVQAIKTANAYISKLLNEVEAAQLTKQQQLACQLAEQELKHTEERDYIIREVTEQFKASWSWKTTAPLRWAYEKIKMAHKA